MSISNRDEEKTQNERHVEKVIELFLIFKVTENHKFYTQFYLLKSAFRVKTKQKMLN